MIDVSALSVKIGAVSALLVLPAAASISFLFRLRDIELTGSETRQRSDCSGGESQHGSPEKVWFLLSMVVFLLFFPCLVWGVKQWCIFFSKVAGLFWKHVSLFFAVSPHRCSFSDRQFTPSPSLLDPALAPWVPEEEIPTHTSGTPLLYHFFALFHPYLTVFIQSLPEEMYSVLLMCGRFWRGAKMMMTIGRTGEKNPEPRELLGLLWRLGMKRKKSLM